MLKDETVNVDDIIETSNHLRCIDLIIENRSKKLSEAFTNELHWVLKSGIYDSRKSWFAYGNGRVGRLIMFKECMRFGVVPFSRDRHA